MVILPVTIASTSSTKSTIMGKESTTIKSTNNSNNINYYSNYSHSSSRRHHHDPIRSRLLNRLGIYHNNSRPIIYADNRTGTITTSTETRTTYDVRTVSPPSSSRDKYQKSLIGNVVPFKEPLKGDDGSYMHNEEIEQDVQQEQTSQQQDISTEEVTTTTTTPMVLDVSSSSSSSSSRIQRGDEVSSSSEESSSSSSSSLRRTISTSSCNSTNSSNKSNNKTLQFDSNVTVIPIPSRYQYSNRIKPFLWSNSDELKEMTERNIVEFQSEGWDWHTVLEDDDMYVEPHTGQLIHPCWFEEEAEFCDDDYYEQQDGIDDMDEENDDDDSSSNYLELERPCLTRGYSCVLEGLDELNNNHE